MEDTRENTCISFFSFPEDRNEINQWCNLIKRRNGTDDFRVTDPTAVCYGVPSTTKFKLFNFDV